MADSNILSDFGIKILEQEIDDVIFQTNEFLCDATFTGSQGPFWWILQMCMALAALFSIVVAGSMAYKMMVRADRHYEAVQASCGQCHSLLVVPTCRYRHYKQRQQLVCT